MVTVRRLCIHNGKVYAVESEGEEFKVGKSTYYITEAAGHNGYILTLGLNGWFVARNKSKEALIANLDTIHKYLGSAGLKEAETISEEAYLKMIKEETGMEGDNK